MSTKHHKTANCRGTPTDAKTACLSDEEIYVLRSFSLLGGIIVDRSKFAAWIGERYEAAIDALINKNQILSLHSGSVENLAMHKIVGDLARKQLKPDLCNCPWAKGLLYGISAELARHAEEAKESAGRKGSMYFEPEMMERAKCVMLMQLALNVLNGLDYDRPENLGLCIEYLTEIISDDLHRAVYFGMSDVMLLERLINSPRFGTLTNKQTFDVYWLLGVAWISALVEALLALSEEQESVVHAYLFNRNFMNAAGGKDIFNESMTADYKCGQAIIGKTMAITEKITTCYLATECLLDGIPDREKAKFLPRLLFPLEEYLRSIGKRCFGDSIHRATGGSLAAYIRGFEERNSIPAEIRGKFQDAHSGDISGMIPDSVSDKLEYVMESLRSMDTDYIDDREKRICQSFSGKAESIISVVELERFIADALENSHMSDKHKLGYLLDGVERLCPNPIERQFETGPQSVYLTEGDREYVTFDPDGFIGNLSEAEKQRKVKDILSLASTLVESGGLQCDYHTSLFYAQLIMQACKTDDRDAVPSYIDEYYLRGAILKGGDKHFPCTLTTDFYKTLEEQGYHDTAEALILKGLDFLETGVESDAESPEETYLLYGFAKRFAECMWDPKKTEYYDKKRLEALGMGFFMDCRERPRELWESLNFENRED